MRESDREAASQALVTVASYSQPLEARVALGRLEDEGIPVFLADENVVTMDWTWSNALGGVRLQVPENHAARAADILSAPAPFVEPDPIEEADDEDRCPSCGSTQVEDRSLGRRLVYASWVVLGVPIPFIRRARRCVACGSRWRPSRR